MKYLAFKLIHYLQKPNKEFEEQLKGIYFKLQENRFDN
jgi:hypothetical protein